MSFIPTKVKINTMVIVESGTYNTQYRRSYSTNENDSVAVDELRDRLAGRGVTSHSQVAGLAGQIVRMSGEPDGELTLDENGWGERRFLFMMSVDAYVRGTALPIRQIIMGYSEYADLTLQSKTIDPHIKFTINSIVTLKPTTTIERGRKVTTMFPQDCSHILANRSFRGLRNTTDSRIDPFNVTHLMMVQQGIHQDDDAPLYSYVGLHTNTPTKVKRSYAQPASYLGSILKSFGDTVVEATRNNHGVDPQLDHMQLCTGAQAHVSGTAASSDCFLQAVKQVSPEGFMTDYFTLADLERLHPNHPAELFLQGQTRKASTQVSSRYSGSRMGDEAHTTGDTSGWGGTDIETQFAAMISHGLPGLMMELFFTEIHFRATNETPDKSILVEVINAVAIEDFDIRGYVDTFEHRIISELLNDACMNGMIDFDFECRCDIVTETWISISIAGGRHAPYNTPTFCDAVMTPMLSNNENANGLANDLNTIVSDLILGENNHNGKHSSGVHGFESNDQYTASSNSPFRIII